MFRDVVHHNDNLTWTSADDDNTMTSYPRSSSSSSGGRPSRRKKPKRKTAPPTLVAQIGQTALLFAVLVLLARGLVVVVPYGLLYKMYDMLLAAPAAFQKALESVVFSLRSLDYTWFLRKPAEWWDKDQVNWDGILLAELYLAIFTNASFAADLLLVPEEKRGSWVLLLPSLIYSVIYSIVSMHAQAIKLLDAEIYLSFKTAEIGAKIFSDPEMVVMTFTHLFALDLALAYAMMKDFYKRTTSRVPFKRLIMTFVALLTTVQGLKALLIYLVLRATLFAGPQIQLPQSTSSNRNSYKRELEYLLDPIPAGGGALSGWVRKIPSPFDIPFFVVIVALGVVRFFLMLGIYFLYVAFVCMPFSAVFFSLRRTWMLNRAADEVMGAIYLPFDTVADKSFPPKAVLTVSGHLRLLCYKNKRNLLFNVFVGWWLRKLLEAFVMYEFTLPFKTDFSPYMGFLMEEFGPVFPMGQGLGYGAYKDVKAIVENPDQRKGDISLAWSTSKSQYSWSKNLLTGLPQTEIEKGIVAQGRQLVRCWLKDVDVKLKNELTRKRLDAILPYAPVDGSMLEEVLLDTTFGSTLFHLLTDGEFTKDERVHYHKLLTNAFPFMSDWINHVWFGGILEYKGIQDYGWYPRDCLCIRFRALAYDAFIPLCFIRQTSCAEHSFVIWPLHPFKTRLRWQKKRSGMHGHLQRLSGSWFTSMR